MEPAPAMEAAMEPAMEAPAANDKPEDMEALMEKKDDKMEEDKKSSGFMPMPKLNVNPFGGDDKEEESEEEEPPKDVIENYCCFSCICANERTKDKTCCGCLPLKCGIWVLGLFYFVLTVVLVSWYFFMMLNEYIDWYFPAVSIALLIPQIVGTCFWVYYFTTDKRSTRGKLGPACQLAIISLALVAIWNLVYFFAFYRRDPDTVYQGLNDGPYKKTPKKVYVFSVLAETAVLVTFFAYAICVSERYYTIMLPNKK